MAKATECFRPSLCEHCLRVVAQFVVDGHVRRVVARVTDPDGLEPRKVHVGENKESAAQLCVEGKKPQCVFGENKECAAVCVEGEVQQFAVSLVLGENEQFGAHVSVERKKEALPA